MSPPLPQSRRSPLGSLGLIAIVIGGGAAAFTYTAGWFSPERLTPVKMLEALAPPAGPALGHRRNHAKGVCFTGTFEANGAGTALSTAQAFASGQYPAVGRFNLGTADADAADATVRVRGMGLQIATPDGQEWRTAMINAPAFPASTPERFYELLLALRAKDPAAVPAFVRAHPEFVTFGAWAGGGTWTGSYAEERYNSLNSFVFTDGSGTDHTVRWSLLPAAQPVSVPPDELAKRDPNFLKQEIAERVGREPVRFALAVTVANPGDTTADPSKPWGDDRRTVEVGTLVVQQLESDRDGTCREINFDPTVLPTGIRTSDDPFPAARSAAYMKSYDLRTAEANDYPRNEGGSKP